MSYILLHFFVFYQIGSSLRANLIAYSTLPDTWDGIVVKWMIYEKRERQRKKVKERRRKGGKKKDQNHSEVLHLFRMDISKKQDKASVDEHVVKKEFLYAVDGNVNWYRHYVKQYEVPSKN